MRRITASDESERLRIPARGGKARDMGVSRLADRAVRGANARLQRPAGTLTQRSVDATAGQDPSDRRIRPWRSHPATLAAATVAAPRSPDDLAQGSLARRARSAGVATAQAAGLHGFERGRWPAGRVRRRARTCGRGSLGKWIGSSGRPWQRSLPLQARDRYHDGRALTRVRTGGRTGTGSATPEREARRSGVVLSGGPGSSPSRGR